MLTFLTDSLSLPVVLKSAVLLVFAVVLVSILMRKSSAGARHLAWVLAIVGMLILPLLMPLLPAWRILPNWNDTLAPITLDFSPIEPENFAMGVQGMDFATETAARNAEATSGITGLSILLVIWFSGVALLMFRLAVSRFYLFNTGRRARIISDRSMFEEVEGIRKQAGIRRKIRVFISNEEDQQIMPMTWGMVRPILFLPAEIGKWEPARRRSVLLHEIAHIRRWDAATHLLVQIVCALHWFNPLVWLAAWRIHIERERACDDFVLRDGGIKASEYAAYLLQILTGFRSSHASAACAMAMAAPGKSQLENRLKTITADAIDRRPVSFWKFAIVSCAAALFVLPIAMLQADDKQETKEAAASAEKLSEELGILDRLRARKNEEAKKNLEKVEFDGFIHFTDKGEKPVEIKSASETAHDQKIEARTTAYEKALRMQSSVPELMELSNGSVLISRDGRVVRNVEIRKSETTGEDAASDLHLFALDGKGNQIVVEGATQAEQKNAGIVIRKFNKASAKPAQTDVPDAVNSKDAKEDSLGFEWLLSPAAGLEKGEGADDEKESGNNTIEVPGLGTMALIDGEIGANGILLVKPNDGVAITDLDQDGAGDLIFTEAMPNTGEALSFYRHASQAAAVVGVGLQLNSTEGEGFEVLGIVQNSPAGKSGKFRIGDRVTGVAQGENGKMVDVQGLDLLSLVKLIRGDNGSEVTLRIFPVGGGENRKITLERSQLALQPTRTPRHTEATETQFLRFRRPAPAKVDSEDILEYRVVPKEGNLGKLGNPSIKNRRMIEKQAELEAAKKKFTPDHAVPTQLLLEIEGLRRLFSAEERLKKEEPSNKLKRIETEVHETKKELESLRKKFQEEHPQIQNRVNELNALGRLTEDTLKEQESSKADKENEAAENE